MPGPFDRHQLLFVERLAEALFDGYAAMAIPIPQVVANFQHQFALIGGSPAKRMGTILRLMPAFLGPDFNNQTVARRRDRIERRLIGGSIDFLQDLARLKAVIYGAYYGHWLPGEQDGNAQNPVLAQIGFTLPKFRRRTAPGDVEIKLLPGRELDPAHVLRPDEVPQDIDVIVVGSGSGGGVSALNIAKLGYKVLVIEAGPWLPSPAITHEERRMGATLFKHGTLQATGDNDIVVFQGRNVGGSPTINNGICLKMWDDPLGNPHAPQPWQEWLRLGTGLNKARFEAAYAAVDAWLPLGTAEPRSGRGNGQHLIAGWNAFAAGRPEPWIRDALPGWFRKNYGPPAQGKVPDTSCAYCGYCNTGCPYARKLAPAQTYLPEACRVHGARVLPDTKVEKIVWAPRASQREVRRATGVLAIIGTGQAERLIPARVGVVIAAGTIASSKLLERSGIEGTGQGISLNVASPMPALMPGAISPAWDEDQMTSAVDCGDFLLESHFQPPQSMAMLMPGWFGEMDRRMRAYGQLRSAGILFPVDRKGKLEGDGDLKVKFAPADMALLRRALATLARVHFATGALEVWPALRSGEKLLPGTDIDAFFARTVKQKDDVTLSSAHPHGGNPIHPDPKKGVVDPECRLHGASNVLVTDASVFPSSIRVNAHFSTMAMAHYATGGADPFGGP